MCIRDRHNTPCGLCALWARAGCPVPADGPSRPGARKRERRDGPSERARADDITRATRCTYVSVTPRARPEAYTP
eukprot:778296-Prymnesium_polylepis.2